MGMAKLFYTLLSLVLVFAFIACTGEKVEEQTEMETEVEATVEKALDENMAECAGCDMAMEKEKMIAHEHDGETQYFCSEKCKEAYMAKEKEEGTKEEPETES